MTRETSKEPDFLSLQMSALEQRDRARAYFEIAQRSRSTSDRAAYQAFAREAILSAERLERRAAEAMIRERDHLSKPAA